MAAIQLRSTKRQKLVLGSIAGAVCLGAALIWPWSGLSAIPLLAINYAIVVWVLDKDLRGREWLILPLYVLVASITGYSLLQWHGFHNWIFWGGIVGYGVILYGLLLTINVLNVATVRALPLTRQALTFLSLAGVAGIFALTYSALAWRPTMVEWAIIVGSISAVIGWPLIWGARVGQISSWRTEMGWTLLVALLGAQLGAIVGMWPISFMTSLALAGGISVMIGLIHHYQNRQLTKQLQQQYLLIGGAVVLALYMASQWT